jgi:hypothetical protein
MDFEVEIWPVTPPFVANASRRLSLSAIRAKKQERIENINFATHQARSEQVLGPNHEAIRNRHCCEVLVWVLVSF